MPKGSTIIGKVAVKVIPDTKNFKKELEADLKKIEESLKDFKVEFKPLIDDEEARKEAKRATKVAQEALGELKLKVNLDNQDSVKASIARLKAEIEKFDQVTLEIGYNKADLEAHLALLQARLDEIAHIDLKVNEGNLKSVERAVARLDSEIEKLHEVDLSVKLDEKSLTRERDRLKKMLDDAAKNVEIDAKVKLLIDRAREAQLIASVRRDLASIQFAPGVDQAKLARTKAEIEAAMISIKEIEAKIKLGVDPIAKRKAELEIDALKAKIESLRVGLKPEVEKVAEVKANAILRLLARTRNVNLRPVVDNAAVKRVGEAIMQLSGGNIVYEKLKLIRELLNNFDKLAPKVAQVGLTIAGIGAAALSSVGNIFSLVGSIASIAGAAFALPGILTGIGIGLKITMLGFTDMKKALPDVYKYWQNLKHTITKDFWAGASKGVRELAMLYMPHLAETAKTVGKFWGEMAHSLSIPLKNSLGPMFDNLHKSITIMTGATGVFAQIISTLGTVGSAYLPRLANWFGTLAWQFNNFLQTNMQTGQIWVWIENGIQALKDLFKVFSGIFKIFAGITKAATNAGGSVLGTLGDALQHIADIVNSPAFQTGLTSVFSAAFVAIHQIVSIAGPQFKQLFLTIGSLLTSILPLVGSTIGTLVNDVASALNQPIVKEGLISMFHGIALAVQGLTPIWMPLGQAIGIIAPILGQLVAAMAPLLAATADTLVPVLKAIMPFVSQLISILSSGLLRLLRILDPIIVQFAQAFADFLQFGAIPAIITVVNELMKALGKLLPVLGNAFISILRTLAPLLPALANMFAQLWTALVPLYTALINALLPAMPILVQCIIDVVDAIAPLLPQLIDNLAPIIPVVAQCFVDLVTAIVPLLPQIVELVGLMIPLIPVFVDFAKTVLPAATVAVVELCNALTPLLSDLIQLIKLIMPILVPALKVLGGVLGGAVSFAFDRIGRAISMVKNGLQGMLDFVTGVFTGDWSKAWDGIKQIFTGFLDFLGIFFGSWPSKIANAVGDLSGVLVKAGKKLMDGFLDGLKSKWNDVKGFFGNLTDKITSWKGPEPRDKVLLVNAGQLIMNGFINGLESRYDAVKDSLRGLTNDMAGADYLGSMAVGGGAMAVQLRNAASGAQATASQSQRILNYYAAPGSSISAEEDLFTAAGRSRMGAF